MVTRYTWEQVPELLAEPRAVALGVFDGLHIGHRAVLAASCGVIDSGAILKSTALCMTGVPKHEMGRLVSPMREQQLFETLGVDEWIDMPFAAVCDVSPAQFVQDILCERLHARVVCCGYNYRFGKNGSGTVETLRELCAERGMRVVVTDAVERDGEVISSTRVRAAITAGDMVQAARLLGRPFSVDLPVTDGDHRGRRWGIPTLNQVFPSGYAVPRYGVYASLVTVGDRQYRAVTNVGVHPTVGGVSSPQAETWIHAFDGELYGEIVSVQLLRFLRDERRFADVEALKAQIAEDSREALAVLNGENDEKAVLFDFDDTLQDRTAAFLAVARQLLSQHMHAVGETEREAYAHAMCEENAGGYVNYSTFFQSFVDRWPFDEGVTGEQLLWEFRRLFPLCSVLFPDAVTVLRTLRERGYRLGIITNGNQLLQNRKLDVTGLRVYVDTALVSEEEGVHKPNAELFLRAAARLGVAPERCVYVGDHPINDVQGALSAGMRPLYLNTRGLAEHPDGVTELLTPTECLAVL